MSASTVSRALSGNSRISQKTRELVQATAMELQYRPNQLASNLRKGKGNLIGVIIPRINRHFFSHAIAGMETITNPAGYNLMICQTNESGKSELESLQTLISNKADGIIMSIAIGTENGQHIENAIKQGVPVVLFDRVFPGLPVDQVVNDNYAGAYEATRHLLDQGYRNIVHFAGPLHLNVYNDRYKGYAQALQETGIQVDNSMVFENVLTRKGGEEVVETMLATKTLPDAIFSASDFSALGALLVLKKHGVHVPESIGICGFANEPFTELTEPGLTSLEQFSEEIGKSAARMLIERISGSRSTDLNSVVSFKPRLMVRDSTLKSINKFKTV